MDELNGLIFNFLTTIPLEVRRVILLIAILIALVYIYQWLKRFWKLREPILLERFAENPILAPIKDHWWESEAVFNPGAFTLDGKVHLFYRALGRDGISRIGYAWSTDGIHFERLPYPVFSAQCEVEAKDHYAYTSPIRLSYDTTTYASGGGWGGCEDPRVVKVGDMLYMTFNMFNGWDAMRVCVTSIHEDDLKNKNWNWKKFVYMANDRQKNWVFFPDKVKGKYALLHSIHSDNKSKVKIKYLDHLNINEPLAKFESDDPQKLKSFDIAWHFRTRSAGPPPIKTKYGWLLLYHAMDKAESHKYKVGAMLLDLKTPTKILARSNNPILEPDLWYENDWKPGIVYASGAVVLGEDLIVYYGGGDKYVAMAKVNLEEFLQKLLCQKS